jgi:DNA-directed RNA polymerase subunit RPC12/RpoP
MIEFLCPHGHKIRCPAEQAGKPAKCPRCGAKFLIPAGAGGAVGASPQPTVAAAELTDLQVASSASSLSEGGRGPRAAASEPQIEFLCPNGHHLHGPASLQGRPGECPECGSRFRIPVLAELEINLEDAADEGEQGAKEEEQISLEGITDAEPAPSAEPLGSQRPVSPLAEGLPAPQPAVQGVDSIATASRHLAELFSQLWAAKPADSRVEVHLESGGVLLPDGFLKDLSQRDVAVLVSKDPDDSYTVNIVTWNTVSRVILRGIRQLPGEVAW